MQLMGANAMSQFFTFKGNDGRLEFLGYYLFSIIIMGVGVWAIELAGGSESMTVIQGLLVLGFIVTGFWVALAASVRRLNDLQRTRWILALFLVPFISMLTFLYLLFAPPPKTARDPGNSQSGNSHKKPTWSDLSEFKS